MPLLHSSVTGSLLNAPLQQGKLVRSLKGHGHWVNTLALSTEHVLRTGAFDHTGKAPADPEAAKQVPAHAGCLPTV